MLLGRATDGHSQLRSRALKPYAPSLKILLSLVIAFLSYPALHAEALALDSATTHTNAQITRNGPVLKLLFPLAKKPRWKLEARGDELWIDVLGWPSQLLVPVVSSSQIAPLSRIRTQNLGNGHGRIVLEVATKSNYLVGRVGRCLVVSLADVSVELDPYRELRPNAVCAEPVRPTRVVPLRRAPTVPSQAGLSFAPSLAAQTRSSPEQGSLGVVMVDPGHGGRDAGAIGAYGLTEKSLALEISLRLVAELRRRGVTALLTRQGDYFVPLAQRAQLANQANVDVFVSIHLNSSPNPRQSGVEVFYLDNTTDRATVRLAQIENAYAPSSLATRNPSLNYILSDLRQEYKADVSAELARLIDLRIMQVLSTRYGLRLNHLGARKGPFFVLVGSHAPSVLIECGFLSNQEEALRLTQPSYQQLIAQAIADALTEYLRSDVREGAL